MSLGRLHRAEQRPPAKVIEILSSQTHLYATAAAVVEKLCQTELAANSNATTGGAFPLVGLLPTLSTVEL